MDDQNQTQQPVQPVGDQGGVPTPPPAEPVVPPVQEPEPQPEADQPGAETPNPVQPEQTPDQVPPASGTDQGNQGGGMV